jgi:hypothetical protein
MPTSGAGNPHRACLLEQYRNVNAYLEKVVSLHWNKQLVAKASSRETIHLQPGFIMIS